MGEKSGGLNLYWGDIHGHTELSEFCYWPNCKPGSLDRYYTYARRASKLDFAAATDHDTDLTDEGWELIKKKAAEYNCPGEFVTFSAYEWTSWVYGHRNVYYLTDDQPFFRCTTTGKGWDINGDTPEDLWRKLRALDVPIITVPHHVAVTQMPVNWDFHDAELEPLVEITSLWGDFEYYGNPNNGRISDVLPGHYVQDALALGYHLGFLGGGESHDCRPGNPTFGGNRKPNILPHLPPFETNPLGLKPAPYISDEYANWRGLTAVYAKELTRDEIFAALKERRCYATTGARIGIEFSLNGCMMGQQLRIDDPTQKPHISATVTGTTKLKTVELIKNNRVVLVWSQGGVHAELEFTDKDMRDEDNYYYLRVVQEDGHKAWSSPIWVKWLSLPRVTVKADSRDGQIMVSVQNEGPDDARRLLVKCYTRLPFAKVDAGLPHQFGPEHEHGAVLWHEWVDDETVSIHLRCKGLEKEQTFSGQLRINGFLKYRAREVNFKTLKYGGDLFADNAEGDIRWNFKSSGEVKGLDITVKEADRSALFLEFDSMIDGVRDVSSTWIGSHQADSLPSKVEVIQYSSELMVGSVLIPELKRSSKRVITFGDNLLTGTEKPFVTLTELGGSSNVAFD